MGEVLLDKVWNAHLVGVRSDGRSLIYVDRHILHELHGPHAFSSLERNGRKVRRPDLTFSMLDHTVATRVGRTDETYPEGAAFLRATREGSLRNGIRLFDLHDLDQGICHVVGPELGMVLPGGTHAVPDSHACTVGGLGALAFACGTTEFEHVLATQVIAAQKPKSMRIRLVGRIGPATSAKDIALYILSQIGIAGGVGHIIEFAGEVVHGLTVEARMTLCNLTIEMGARSGLIAPDDATFSWLAGRPMAPEGEQWEQALAWWRTLPSDDDAIFDRDIQIDCNGLTPQISWGTNPAQVMSIDGMVPSPACDADPQRRAGIERAMRYMGLVPGDKILGQKIGRVFIGSCTNSRLSDLEAAAKIFRGRKVAPGVTTLVVPGSALVKRQAEAMGLDRIFVDAGCIWGESGCSMCSGSNGDRAEPGERCISTTNRNFENRQGRAVRTHLAGPAVAAACAVAGCIADPRVLEAKQ